MQDDQDQTPEPKSKSQLKRAAAALQDLGATLVELPATRFNALILKLDLPENLSDALLACRGIHERGGRRRQLQYIGKLMRGIDPAPIQQALEAFEGRDRTATVQLHQIERWRERLLEEGDTALAELLQAYPQADTQHLRQLIINGRKELAQRQPPRAARALFRYLRGLMGT